MEEFKPVTIRELDEIRCSPTGDLAPFGDTFLATRLQEVMTERFTPAAERVILRHVMASTYCSISHIRSPYHVIPVANGDVDVFTGKLYEHKETEWQFLQRFENITYDPNIRPKYFHRILDEIQPDPEIQYRRILRPFALVFDRTLVKRNLEVWMGPPDSGKTTLLKVLQRMTSPFASNISLQTLTNDKDLFALAGLVDKAVNISGDLARFEIEDVGILKQLVGGDMIPIRKMHHEPVSIPIPTKFFAACNGPPYIEKGNIWEDSAFWERIRITPFTKSFTNVKDDSLTLDEGREEESKLLNKHEISGIFNVLLGILRGVYLYRDYGFEFLANESREIWQKGQTAHDKVNAVINEHVYMDERRSIPVDEFYQEINDLLKKRGLGHVTRQEINERMYKMCKQSNNGRVRVWRGVGWKNIGLQSTLVEDSLNGFNGIYSSFTRSQNKIYGTVHASKSVNSVNFLDVPMRSWFGQFPGRPSFYAKAISKVEESSSTSTVKLPESTPRSVVFEQQKPEPTKSVSEPVTPDTIISEMKKHPNETIQDIQRRLHCENTPPEFLDKLLKGTHYERRHPKDAMVCDNCPDTWVEFRPRGIEIMKGHLKEFHGRTEF